MAHSSQATPPSVLVVGAGAIGSFYGAVLARQGACVDVVCRADYAWVREHGYHIDSPLGMPHFRPERVLRSTAAYGGGPDYLLLCTKVLDSLDRVSLIRDAVAPHTAIVLIQNGVEIEGELAEAFPDNELISALAFIAVSRVETGRIHHKAFGHLVLGNYPSGITDAARRLAAMFDAGGVGCTLRDDVVGARWEKCVWNAAFNPVSVAGGGLDTVSMLAHAESERTIRAAMAEVCAVAEACGHPQREELIENHIAGTKQMPAYKTSMALDFEHGREMEVEAILGNVVRAGRRQSVPIPVLETLYGLLQMVQTRARSGS